MGRGFEPQCGKLGDPWVAGSSLTAGSFQGIYGSWVRASVRPARNLILARTSHLDVDEGKMSIGINYAFPAKQLGFSYFEF